jgi:membrane protein YdbS with pleckstrin-like domain
MPPFKNREEYEKWKAERLKQPAQSAASGNAPVRQVAADSTAGLQPESYLRRNLRPGENIILEARLIPLPTWVVIGVLLPFLALFTVGMFAISAAAGLLIGLPLLVLPPAYAYLRLKRTELGVTDLRVVEQTGVFSDNTVETPLDRIQNVIYKQDVLEKIFGCGTVIIQSAARFGVEGINGVKDPRKVRDAILQQVELYRQKQVQEQAEAIAKSMLAKQRS